MSKTIITEKLGEKKKCPYCGAPISGMATKCPECGHEFSNIAANSTISNLTASLEKIDRTSPGNEAIKRKIQVIQNFPVPNTKEDIVEILTMCRSNMESKAEPQALRNAWKTKALQMISKSEMLLKGDKEAQYLVQSIKANEARKKKRLIYGLVTLLIVIAAGVGGFAYYNHSAKEDVKAQSTELTTMKSTIHKLITEGNYDEAYAQIDNVNNYMIVHETEHLNFDDVAGDLYLKLVIALVREGDLPGAAMVGLDYREKLNDDYKWRNSQIYKILIQECEAQDYDDAPLR